MSVAARRTPREGDDEERPLRRREYELLVASGAFDDERVELLDGRIVPMSPQGSLHGWVVRRLIEAFAPRLAGRAVLQVQGPLAASESSEPEPDLALLPPEADRPDAHPGVALLVVEVADSSLRRDRRVKARVYAEMGVPEYWIVNLVDGCVEVHVDPVGGRYERTRTERSGALAPEGFPDLAVDVGRLVGAGAP